MERIEGGHRGRALAWQAPERFKAIRLLRLDARDVMHAPAVIAILQACQMLDPDAGGLVDGYWNELLAANAGWSMERLRAWVPEMSLPADQAAARQELADIVKNARPTDSSSSSKSTKKSASSRQSTAAHDLSI